MLSLTTTQTEELNTATFSCHGQIVVCQNVARSEGLTQGVMTHELIHMFDYCRNKLDFKNIDHLACTEVRAANLAHCSFLSACTQGDASPFNIAKTHQVCTLPG